MTYRDLRKLFHDPAADADGAYESRFNDPRTLHLDTTVSGAPAFVFMAPEIYEAMLEAARLDKEILKLELSLPGRALESYRDSCLIDEIVLTNEIEGVRSTRREIGEVLERLRENDRNGRFLGIVQKYELLESRSPVATETCPDIRAIYDDLVLAEVRAADPGNVPDGRYFRRGVVHVVDQAGIPIHDGLEPESRIIEELDNALRLLNDDGVELLVRVALFHFLFGYIHPFYDGNGRTNRFISSYLIAQEYEPLVGLALSFAVKNDINKYYKAFTTCEHALNRGDLTPFVISFCEIIVQAMRNLRDSLVERRRAFEQCVTATDRLVPPESRDVAEVLATATLFSFEGISGINMARAVGISRQTLYKRLEPLKELGLVEAFKVGRKTHYALDRERLEALVAEAPLSPADPELS